MIDNELMEDRQRIMRVVDRDLEILRERVWERASRQIAWARLLDWTLWVAAVVLVGIAIWEGVSW